MIMTMREISFVIFTLIQISSIGIIFDVNAQTDQQTKLQQNIAEYCQENWRKAPDMCSEYIPEGYYEKTAQEVLTEREQQKIQQFRLDIQNKECPTGTEKQVSGLEVICVPKTSTQNINSNFNLGDEQNILYYVIGFVIFIIIIVAIVKAASGSRSGNEAPNYLQIALDNDFENLNGDEFESIVGTLYRKKGYQVTKTPKGPDQGIDLIAIRGSEKIIIQTKNWKSNVSNTDILKTAGARQMHKATSALVITSSRFTKSAIEALQNTPKISGLDIDALKREFYKNFKR